MSALMTLLILVAVQGISLVHGEEEEDNKGNWYFSAYEGMEYEPKCNVRRSWLNVELLYTMMCVECADRSFVVISYDSGPIGAYRNVNCGNIQWSVTVLPPQSTGSELSHIVQVDLTKKKCARLTYQRVDEIYVPQKSACVYSNRWKKFYLGWKNGWKEIKISPARGVVKEIIPVNKQTDVSCQEQQTWTHYKKSFSMKCYDCPDEYVVKVFKDNSGVGAAIVTTCMPPDVERSVTVVETKAKEVFRTQYQLVTEQCDMRTYTRDANGFHEQEGGGQCTDKPRRILAMIIGYRNGWKKQAMVLNNDTNKAQPNTS